MIIERLKDVDKKILGKEGSIIEYVFNPCENTMDYFLNGMRIASLTDIQLFKSEVYTPCIIFLHNCSIEVIFAYPSYY